MVRTGTPLRRSAARRWGLAILALCIGLLAGCKSELFGKVDEADANAALDILYGEGIRATKSSAGDGLWRVEVDEKDHQRALQITRSQGVPRERFVSMGDLFQKEGLVSTPSEIRMRYLYAVSQELSNTLSHIDGVISARVHPVIPVNDPLSDKVQLSSAAVFIKHLPDADLQQMAPAIKTLVTRSIEGLRVEHVSLTFFATRLPTPPPAGPLPVAHASIIPGGPVVSSLAILLGSCLAFTWSVVGLRMWRRSMRLSQAAALPVAARRPARAATPAPSTSSASWNAWPDAIPAAGVIEAPLDADVWPYFDATAAGPAAAPAEPVAVPAQAMVLAAEPVVVAAQPAAVAAQPVAVAAEPVVVAAWPVAVAGHPLPVGVAPVMGPAESVAVFARPVPGASEPGVVPAKPAAAAAKPVPVATEAAAVAAKPVTGVTAPVAVAAEPVALAG